ncbi:MAG TPA: alpha/beta hydrolase, partial [Pseudonocardiaceae bacterium]|nr:alpha/beta hydrolase [Pseudonocardiaceae bacterium]
MLLQAMGYAFDPELAPWVSTLPQTLFDDVPAERARRRQLLDRRPHQPPRPVDVRDINVPGLADGPDVPVRIYTPEDRKGHLPGFVYLHGGGYAFGDLDMVHPGAARMAAEVGSVVVSVGYRLAPEHPFPSALDDAYTALGWVAAHAEDLRVDPLRLGIGGDSAGGGLAAAVALLARDRGGPRLCFQYLNVPKLDDRMCTPSALAFVDTPNLTRRMVELCWRYYLGERAEPGGADVSAYAAPARAGELSGLPPAFVVACEFDPFRDEDIEYAQRLMQAGVSTELRVYPGTFHG